MSDARLPQTKLILPTYTERFRCIGPACEDTCCQGWGVSVDKAAWEKYQILPASPLRKLLDANILLTAKPEDGSEPPSFATIRMTASNRCSLLSEGGLCRIQPEYGEAYLPHTCATYPRIVHSIGNIEEKALTLSCPEAARLVLLNRELLDPSSPAITEPPDTPLPRQPGEPHAVAQARALRPWFWSIREAVLTLVGNRDYPLWQRLFLLGVLCRRLDFVAKGCLDRPIKAVLRDFAATVASGALRAAMDHLPLNPARQLDVVLSLAGRLLHRSNIHPRFAQCVQAFTAGIGNSPAATLESLTTQYAEAHDRFYAPFFDRNPHILENYLINTIFRCQFPFGCEGTQPVTTPSMPSEHTRLIAQFTLMKGLLIGVAGFHREGFCAEHVVHTIQSASKHFEHHAKFLEQAHALLAQRQMNGTLGLAFLLRNGKSSAPAMQRETARAPLPRKKPRAAGQR
ncbi:MAG: flagellin lysine-N-methylase [Candidatus Acidiferrum sp.]